VSGDDSTHIHGVSQPERPASKQLGVARDTVGAALASDGPPQYRRATGRRSIGGLRWSRRISAAEPGIRALLSVYLAADRSAVAPRSRGGMGRCERAWLHRQRWPRPCRDADLYRWVEATPILRNECGCCC